MLPAKLNLTKSNYELERALELIPGGVLGIRRPYNFVTGEFPVFFDNGSGGRVFDIDNNEYIDFLCAYGPILLGYRETEVDDAVIKQIQEKGFCFSLTQTYQNELAEKIHKIIPCGEKSIFLKTGSDATTCAVRLARAYTGKAGIIRCGYHGWHDWCVEVKGGIPEKLYEDVSEFHYNDLVQLEKMLEESHETTAAVIMTPFGHPLAHPLEEPKPGFLEGVRKLTEKYGVILIFDEIRTGFRMALGGAQEYYGVTPDMAVFGKAIANGYPLSLVTGKKEIMDKGVSEVFISSTFFPNSLEYVAALKTIEIIERDHVIEKLFEKGENFLKRIDAVIKKHPSTGARLSGVPVMFFITFDKDEKGDYKAKRKEFYTYLIRRGIFLQPYHHGYICHRHTEEDLDKTVEVIEEALADLTERYK